MLQNYSINVILYCDEVGSQINIYAKNTMTEMFALKNNLDGNEEIKKMGKVQFK